MKIWKWNPTIYNKYEWLLKILEQHYHNLNFAFTTKARVCKGAGQEGSSGVTSHAPRSEEECEGMNPHTPKWAPTLGVGILMDSQIFKEQLQGSIPIGLRSSLYHYWKELGT